MLCGARRRAGTPVLHYAPTRDARPPCPSARPVTGLRYTSDKKKFNVEAYTNSGFVPCVLLGKCTLAQLAAQEPDGYVNCWYLEREPQNRWTNLRDNHELYCAGHMLEAAVALAERLLTSEKDRWEHALAVESLAVGAAARSGSSSPFRSSAAMSLNSMTLLVSRGSICGPMLLGREIGVPSSSSVMKVSSTEP